jgi:hypothetical protein
LCYLTCTDADEDILIEETNPKENMPGGKSPGEKFLEHASPGPCFQRQLRLKTQPTLISWSNDCKFCKLGSY